MFQKIITAAAIASLGLAQNLTAQDAAPERWQAEKADPNSGITITYSINNGPTKKYDPTFAWISDNSKGLVGAKLAVYCGTFGRKKMIMVWDNQYRSDQLRPVVMDVDGKVFSADAEDVSITFGNGNEFGFEAEPALIRALKAGAEVSYTLAGSERGTYTLSGSTAAINKALQRCR